MLQDDALPCDGFAEAVHAAILDRPGSILCLFAPGFGYVTRPMQAARARGERWMAWRTRAFVPLVAVVYPAAHPARIVEFSEKRKVHMGRADDAIVATYCRALHVPVWATVPCLVEHRDELPSVMKMRHGRGQPHRLAAYYRQDGGTWRAPSAVAV